jgi:hypothetical protein
VLTEILVLEIENETPPFCSGGFADISKIIVKGTKKQEARPLDPPPKPMKFSLVKKAAKAKEKMFWEKSVIQHFGVGACIFINSYFKVVKLDSAGQ